MICVFSIEEYNGTRAPIESNIDFVGYLGNEQTVTTGSREFGKTSETRFTIDGLGEKLSVTPVSTFGVNDDATPTAWDDIENPTPVRTLVYLLSEHTTFLNLCAFKFPSNHTDFIAPGEIFASESDIANQAAQYQADAMGGILQYGRDGILDMTLNLVESDDTARNAADTVVAMTPSDWLDYSLDIQPVPVIRFLEIYAGVYNTSSALYTVYQSFTPPVPDVRGVSVEQRVNMILTTDLTDANAQAEFAERSANLYAALNPTDILRVTLNDEWRFLQPDVGAWYTFTVALTDTARGIAYDSNTRWQLLEIGYTSNNATGRKQVNAVFRKETQTTGANIEVAAFDDTDINAIPGVLPPFTGGDLGLTDGNWFDSFDPAPPTDPTPPRAGCELVGFRPQLGVGAYTSQSVLLGEAISVLASGTGVLQAGGEEVDDFTASDNNWYNFGVNDSPFGQTITTGTTGTHSGGTGWTHNDFTTTGGNHRAVCIEIDLGSEQTVTYFKMTYNLTKGSSNTPTNTALALRGYETDRSLNNLVQITFSALVNGSGQTAIYEDSSGGRSSLSLCTTIFYDFQYSTDWFSDYYWNRVPYKIMEWRCLLLLVWR